MFMLFNKVIYNIEVHKYNKEVHTFQFNVLNGSFYPSLLNAYLHLNLQNYGFNL